MSFPPDTQLLEIPHRSPRSSHGSELRRVLYVTDFYVEELLLGVVDFARETDWDLIANMRFHGYFPSEAYSDGIVATVNTPRVAEWLAQRRDCSIVRMLATAMEDLPYPAVEVDYFSAGQLGARHLLELGHKEFAFYWMVDVPDAVEIRLGFAAEMAAAHRRVHWMELSAAFPGRDILAVPRDERLGWLDEQLLRLPKPIAIMCDDDRRALELLRAADRLGLKVPEEIAMIGCDNHAVELGMARIPLSSVQIDFRSLGYRAAELLQEIMCGKNAPKEPIKVPPRGVVARRSTATFVTDEPGITAAVLHLREHFHTPLRVEQLARIAGVSTRVFETQFRRYVGCSAREAIHRARLACAARLLRDSDLKLDAIAVESGFGSGKYLSAAFTKVYGLGPSMWRQQVRTTHVMASASDISENREVSA
jgi:LacI family transcriptional regulator